MQCQKAWSPFQASVHSGCYRDAHFQNPGIPRNPWLPCHLWYRYMAERELGIWCPACLMHLVVSCHASQVVFKFMRYTDLPLLSRPETSFSHCSFFFPSLIFSIIQISKETERRVVFCSLCSPTLCLWSLRGKALEWV